MTTDVIVTVKGKQISPQDAQADDIEIISVGTYHERNGKKYIRYEEQHTEIPEKVTTLIKYDSKNVEITKKGSIGTQMKFLENERIQTCYETPFGMIMMVIYTKFICVEEEEDKIEISISYELEANGEHMTDADVSITVTPRGTKTIKLI